MKKGQRIQKGLDESNTDYEGTSAQMAHTGYSD